MPPRYIYSVLIHKKYIAEQGSVRIENGAGMELNGMELKAAV
jgi:hypothetical protein